MGEGSWSPMEPQQKFAIPVMLSMSCHANLHTPFLHLEGGHEDPECPYVPVL